MSGGREVFFPLRIVIGICRDEAARAAIGKNSPQATALAERLKGWLHDGQLDRVIATPAEHAARLGQPRQSDGAEHPRRVPANNVAYFQKHRHHMDYPVYRRKGRLIGSGVTESGVKQFNKRVKGTDQFWNEPGVEAILAFRAPWLSRDDRWSHYWTTRPAHQQAA